MAERQSEKPLGRRVSRWSPFAAFIPALCGILWVLFAARAGTAGALLAAPPGALMLGTGLSSILWSSEARNFQFMSVGSLLGMVLSLPAALALGPVPALVVGSVSVASFLATGYLALLQHRYLLEMPLPERNPGMAARAAIDEAMMCGIVFTSWPVAVGPAAARIRREVEEGYPLFRERGWFTEPAAYHLDPPPLERPESRSQSHGRWRTEFLSFESGYEPRPDEPGRDLWLSYKENRTAHAWVLRHPGEPRPWLVCLHGIRMSTLGGCLSLFPPEYLYEELGLNLLMPVLPFHGPRRSGLIGGRSVFSGDVMSVLHTGGQAVWDIRRLVSWLRESQDAPAIGVSGYSLGGYVSALLASLERDLDCAIAGNPAVDPIRLYWNNALAIAIHSLKAQGVYQETLEDLMRPVSPLSLAPVVPIERRAIVAGVVDRVVPPIEAYSLWRHWERPRIAWHQGSHAQFLQPSECRTTLEDTLRSAAMLPHE